MKDIIDYLRKKHLIFKKFIEIAPKDLGSRKKVSLYIAVDMKEYYNFIISIEKKSRILKKRL